jgi:hypothetical protein
MRATTGGLGARRGAPAAIPVAFVRPLLRHLLSFEMVFALYLYSNRFEPVLPPLPFDTTPLFAGLTVAGIAYALATTGFHTRGLPVVVAGLAFVAWVALSATWSPSRVLASYTVTYLATFNLMCVAAGALVVARSRERAVRLLVLVTIFSLLLALWGLWIFAVYGSFRFADFGPEAGRMYLNWGYGASSGAIVAFCVTTYARFGSRAQLLGAASFCVILAFLLVSSGRGPLLSVALVCLLPLLAGLDLSDRRRVGARVSVLVAAALVVVGSAYVAYLVASGQGSPASTASPSCSPRPRTRASSRARTGSATGRRRSSSGTRRRWSATAPAPSRCCSSAGRCRAPTRTTSSWSSWRCTASRASACSPPSPGPGSATRHPGGSPATPCSPACCCCSRSGSWRPSTTASCRTSSRCSSSSACWRCGPRRPRTATMMTTTDTDDDADDHGDDADGGGGREDDGRQQRPR